ncbi:lipopolysaccharide biosynthesis protein [Streptomyces sp. CC228A]|uniref:lipopolysaccharide biosynthesis protein n=1 Tax=Streptomyces sp. CC228A TaxID=2898186 RepID=UPI001F1A78F5|nr:lipopolysaccharide biosynthesis protein [Streptomyces sp. CC228A]
MTSPRPTPRTFLPLRRRLARLSRRVARRLPRAERLRRPGPAWIVPGAVLLGLAAGGGYGLLKTPQYAATSYVVVVPAERSDPAGAMGLAQAYGRVATDIAVAGDAAVWARVSPAVLRASVQAATSPDAPMISLTARSTRPATAAAMADSVARALVQKGSHAETSTNVRVVQFARATRPTSPVSPSPALAALVGASAGGLLGGLALLVRPRRKEGAADTAPGTATVPAPSPAAQPQPESV